MRLACLAASAPLVVVLFAHDRACADTLLVPSQHATIQSAIDASLDGDVIVVADGSYTGAGNRDLDFGGRAITVRSANGAASCTLDLQGSALDPHRALHFHAGEEADSVVQGFTIKNGWMTTGGAVLVENGSSPSFVDCSFQANVAGPSAQDEGGGAVTVLDGDPTFSGCAFTGNHVDAIPFTGGGALLIMSGGVLMTDCTFTGNSVSETLGSSGGGAIVSLGNLTADDSTFSANSSTHVGGAFILDAGAQTTLNRCVLEDNVADAGGGAFSIQGLGTYLAANDCQFVGNTSGQNWGGGALRVFDQAVVDLVGCELSDNAASGGGGGGVWIFGGAWVDLTDCDLTDNHTDQSGGAVGLLQAGSQLVAQDCRFVGNTTGASGGGVLLDAGTGSFTGCVFGSNQAGTSGGGLRVRNLGAATLARSTFAQNLASSGGALRVDSFGQATVVNSILWSSAPGELAVSGGGAAAVSYSDVAGGWPGTGNIDADPLFWDPSFGDYHLMPGSPCVDAGDPGSPLDPDGSTADMGAFPFDPSHCPPSTTYCTAGTTANGCNALISAVGTPSASSPSGYLVTVDQVEGQKLGIVFWGSAAKASPWGQGTSYQCVAAPVRRTGTQSSAGTANACDGTLALDFNAWAQANPAKAPAVGDAVYVQGWFRDPPSPKSTSLSDALRFVVCP